MSNTNERRSRRKFTDELKAYAVATVDQSGSHTAKVAKELGVYDSPLGNWVRQAFEKADGEPTPEERAEIRVLKKEPDWVTWEWTFWESNGLLLGKRPERWVMAIYSFIAEEPANNSIWHVTEMFRVLEMPRSGFGD